MPPARRPANGLRLRLAVPPAGRQRRERELRPPARRCPMTDDILTRIGAAVSDALGDPDVDLPAVAERLQAYAAVVADEAGAR